MYPFSSFPMVMDATLLSQETHNTKCYYTFLRNKTSFTRSENRSIQLKFLSSVLSNSWCLGQMQVTKIIFTLNTLLNSSHFQFRRCLRCSVCIVSNLHCIPISILHAGPMKNKEREPTPPYAIAMRLPNISFSVVWSLHLLPQQGQTGWEQEVNKGDKVRDQQLT